MTPEKMLMAKRIGREVIRENGPQMVGPFATALLLGKSGLKSALIRGAAMLGRTNMIVRARSRISDPHAFEVIHSDIERIRMLTTPVGTGAELAWHQDTVY